MPEFVPGEVFGDLRVEGLAGRGGMGIVYRATQLVLERTVALKVINPVFAEDEDFRRRFVAESKAAALIEHPHVVPIYHAGQRDGVLFIVMRYIDGPDMRALVRAQGCLDGDRGARIVAQVGEALDAAHRRGLVHRDVKPANVLLGEDDHAYLTDFGLTKRSATTAGDALSRAGGWVGTLGYVAPEQIRGDRVDARSDVYALGCVLVYALTGRPPYARDSDEATLWAHLNAPPPIEHVPPPFKDVIARALAKDPSDRYSSAGDLGRAARAATGRYRTGADEPMVARGAAAALSEDETRALALRPAADAETRPSPDANAEAVTATPRRPTDLTPALTRSRQRTRRPRVIAGACVLGAAGLVTALAAGVPGDSDGTRTSTTVPTTPPRGAGPRPSRPGAPVRGVPSPLAVTSAGGKVWFSGRSRRLHIHDPRSADDVRRGPDVGAGSHSVASLRGSVWLLNARTNRLIRISARSESRVPRATIDLEVPGRAVVITAGAGALWVGVRNRGNDKHNEYVVRIDPDGYKRIAILVPGGVQDLAVAGRWLWVTNRATPTVTQIRVATSQIRNVIPVGRDPKGLAVGEGAVWVAASGDDKITRINPRSLERESIALRATPDRVAVGGGSVWVTSRAAARVLRINPRSRKILETIPTGYDPFALEVANDSVWLTLVRENAVQRIRYFR